jgi:hypothetical protein
MPGSPARTSKQVFVMQEHSDGSTRLLPVDGCGDAQFEYNRTLELKDLLGRAYVSGTVLKRR